MFGAQRTGGNIARCRHKKQKYAKRAQRLHRENDQQTAEARRNALAALETKVKRKVVAQNCAERADNFACLRAEPCFADQHGSNALEQIARERQQSVFFTHHAQHVCRARIAAALASDVLVPEHAGNDHARGDAAQQVADDKRQNQLNVFAHFTSSPF